jgi:hypothetical protein
MKRSIISLWPFLMLFGLAGCGSLSSSHLTEAKAQSAVQTWIARTKNGGSVAVLGLQDLPQQNSAKADLSFTNLQYRDQALGPQTFSGKGSALFTHYTDGRWVLTQVATDNGFNSLIQATNIEAN